MTDTQRFADTLLTEAQQKNLDMNEYARIVSLAKHGHFHDFKSPSAFPKTDLISRLIKAGFKDTAGRVAKGEFDE